MASRTPQSATFCSMACTKSTPGTDAGHVHKDAVGPKLTGEIIEEPAGLSLSVIAAIADENGISHTPP